MARRHGDFALVGAAALVTLSDGTIGRARVAVFGCGATPTRATAAEAALAGRAPTAALIEEAARAAASALDPHADLHASAEYRRRVARVLMIRALTDAVARAAR